MASSDNEDPLVELERLLKREWEDDGGRVSVVINQPLPPAPPTPTRSLFPPQLDPKSPITRWVMTVALALAAIGGAVKMVMEWFE